MTQKPTTGPDLPTLHAILDHEVSQAQPSQAATTSLDPELQAYLLRLQGLRQAVLAMEQYENSLGEL
jgi:hypothetical protein